jgi:hypothetical protein
VKISFDGADSMAMVVVEKGNPKDMGREFVIDDENALIGRSTTDNNPTIALNDDYVSRRHAEITFDGERFFLRDLNSTNGTSVDHLRIEPGKSCELSHESIIGLAVTADGARVLLRFKASPTVRTTRIGPEDVDTTTGVTWLRIDEARGDVWVDNKLLVLSRKEYDLLLCLRNKAGKICDRDELIARVWPEVLDPSGVADAAIDQLVHRLRLKVEPDPSQATRIVSRRGFGYMLV